MSIEDLNGAWQSPSINFPGCTDFMNINLDKKRIITFLTIQANSTKCTTIALWFEISINNAKVILTKDRPNRQSMIDPFLLENGTLYWLKHGKKYSWNILRDTEIPAWWHSRIQKVDEWMDMQEVKCEGRKSRSEQDFKR